MRYNEILREYQNNRKMNMFRRAMEAAGMTEIGDGYYALVMRARDGGVVKVFEPDPCYLGFIDLVKQHSTNPHFPLVRKVARFMKGRFKGNYLLKMESLQPMSVGEFNADKGFHCYFAASMPERYRGEYSWSSEIAADYVKEGGDAKELAASWEKENAAFAQAIQLIWSNLKSGCVEDIHFQNVMKRGQTWVIIDPYA